MPQQPAPASGELDSSDRQVQPIQWWVRNLNLKQEDKQRIESGLKLDDPEINAIHRMISQARKQPYQAAAKRDYVDGFTPVPGPDHIQILHIGVGGQEAGHWVLSILKDNDKVQIADSSRSGLVDPQLASQLKQLYPQAITTDTKMKVELLPVLRQQNTLDCGIFAIANAFEVLEGRRPEDATYKRQQMHSHLIKILEANPPSPRPFPKFLQGRRYENAETILVDVSD